MPLTHRSFNFNVKTKLNKSSVDKTSTTFRNSASVANQILFLLHKLGMWLCKHMKMSKNVHQNIWGNFSVAFFLFKCVQIAYFLDFLLFLFFSQLRVDFDILLCLPNDTYLDKYVQSPHTTLCFSVGFYGSTFKSMQCCCYKTFIAFPFVINRATVRLG